MTAPAVDCADRNVVKIHRLPSGGPMAKRTLAGIMTGRSCMAGLAIHCPTGSMVETGWKPPKCGVASRTLPWGMYNWSCVTVLAVFCVKRSMKKIDRQPARGSMANGALPGVMSYRHVLLMAASAVQAAPFMVVNNFFPRVIFIFI